MSGELHFVLLWLSLSMGKRGIRSNLPARVRRMATQPRWCLYSAVCGRCQAPRAKAVTGCVKCGAPFEGAPNKSAIARATGISRQRVQRILAAVALPRPAGRCP